MIVFADGAGFATGVTGIGAGAGIDGCGATLEGGIIGAPPSGAIIGAPNGGGGAATGTAARPLPQLRQNFMPGGFSPRQIGQITGNPGGDAGVCPYAGGGADSALPQLRQNDDPAGLSWPHIEQRIRTLAMNPHRVSQHARRSGMGAGRFACARALC
jgi:hypothetical protein